MLWVPIPISYSFSSTSRSGYTTCSTSNLILTASEILSLTFIARHPKINGYHDRLPKSLPTHNPWTLFLLIQYMFPLCWEFIIVIKSGSYYHPGQLYRPPHLTFLQLLSMSSLISKTQTPLSRKKYYYVKQKGDNSINIMIRLQFAFLGNRYQTINVPSPTVSQWLWGQTSFL